MRAGLRTLTILALVATTLAQVGCGTARRSLALRGPMQLADPQLVLGQQVFAEHCYQCHPGGEAGLGPAINNKPLPQTLIRLQVRQGLGVMPAFDEQAIDDEQLDAVAKYLAALRDHRAPKD